LFLNSFIMENQIDQVPGTLPGESTHPARNVPRPDIVFGHICNMVGQQWLKTKWLTVQWLPVDQFVQSATLYNALLTDKTVQGSNRPQVTRHLRQLDKKIDSSIEYIKGYLVDKYSKTEAPAYFEAFGIVRHGEGFVMPKHRHLRQESLTQMLKGIWVRRGLPRTRTARSFGPTLNKSLTVTSFRPPKWIVAYLKKRVIKMYSRKC